MGRSTIFKFLIIAVLAILILIPLGMIKYKISERAQLRSSAEQSVAASWTREQQISGPSISVAYQRKVLVPVTNKDGEPNGQREEYRQQRLFITPENAEIKVVLDTSVLKRGIYPVRIYTANMKFTGQFNTQSLQDTLQGLRDDANVRHIGVPLLHWKISDPRGLNTVSKLSWGGQRLQMAPGAGAGNGGAGIHTSLDSAGLANTLNTSSAIPYAFDIALRGMNSIHFAPGGKQTQVSVAANWPHPKFTGAFLPSSRTITESDFNAEWSVSEFATAATDQARRCAPMHCDQTSGLEFGVQLVDPVDVYLQSERAAKYGFLFVILVFVGFAMFELLKKLRIHPMQYTLVGVSIAMFFLLLISLAEHLGFPKAYAGASFASVGIIALYLRSVLASWSSSIGFSAVLCALYGLLFIIIRSEDYALLMGASLCFAVLAAVMMLTRKLDWYGLEEKFSVRHADE